ncbi:MAG TPA: beta-eliminating lyase-related protein [Gemmatimonadales bacterium]|nr:beta-eliminating lyase-related protein [Gemmatimonadales bacterium]
MTVLRSFASDNAAGAHPDVLEALVAANDGYAEPYGADTLTRRAADRVRAAVDADAEVFFTWGGTAANILGLAAVTRAWHGVICAEQAHIAVDECGGPERFIGCKLLTVPTRDGRLTPDGVRSRIRGVGVEHHVQPAVVSLTQATEYGTVYTAAQVGELADLAHGNGMLVHMDGARLANAAASLGEPLAEFTWRAGVDVLSFGGTKNGLLSAEAVVFFEGVRDRARDFPYIRKQGMGLASKMRFVAAQFDAVLAGGLWLRNADHANRMAKRLAAAVQGTPGLLLTQPVEANAVFAVLPRRAIEALRERYYFYVWDEAADEVRWMTTFATTEAEVDAFADDVRGAVAAAR